MSDPAPSRTVQRLPIEFHGSGKEYFRIWIVNLLLLIVTLTLYYPWARVRKLTYFAQNTAVAGHPLSFHGQAKQMFPGFIIAMIAAICYFVSQDLFPEFSLALLAVYLLIWPWVFRMANRFRMAMTQWRGLRFGFSGTNKGAYTAFLVPLLVYGAMLGIGALVGAVGIDPEEMEAMSAEQAGPVFAWFGLMVIVGILAAPYFLFLIKRYQHSSFAYASLKTRFTGGPGGFYLIAIKTVLLAIAVYVGLILAILVIVVLGIVLSGGSISNIEEIGEQIGSQFSLGAVGLLFTIGIGFYVLTYVMFSAISAYTKSATFNFTWSKTDTDQTHFLPELKFSRLWRLQIKNTLLILCTLGLYIPFAQIALARLKLHSLQIETEQDLNTIIADVQTGRTSAVVDAAADILDIDIGL